MAIVDSQLPSASVTAGAVKPDSKVIGGPPPVTGAPIDGDRGTGVKTVGADHRFKVKKGIDLQGGNIINAALVPTLGHELATKDYVDDAVSNNGSGNVSLPVATNTVLGGVKMNRALGVQIDANGFIGIDILSLPLLP